MKHFFRAAMLICMATVFLSAWSLPTVAASKVASAKKQTTQGQPSFNSSGKGNAAQSPYVRGAGEFSAVSAISPNDIWAVGDGIGTLIEHWNGTQWSIVKSLSPGADFNNLYGVAAIAANDVWAVGSYSNNQQVSDTQTLIEHWNGAKWSIVSSPSPGAYTNILSGVAAVSANDVWAVGNYSPNGGSIPTLIEHWNGTQWSIVSSPSPNNDAFLNNVTAVSAANVWAVGYYFSNGFSGAGSQTLIEHWNGSQWSVIPSPNSGSQYNNLYGVAAVSANNIWAVGNVNNGSQTLIEQWNGSSWSIIPSPNPGSTNNSLNAVAAVSANDVWAVGGEQSGTSSERTLIEQWNGTQWSVVTSPSIGTGTNRLNAVATLSSSDVWAVGVSVNGTSQSLTEQWNGRQWRVVNSPDRIGNGGLAGVANVSNSDIWAVGTDVSGALIEHWNGSKWSFVKSPNPGSFGNSLNAVAAVSASDIWAVGEYGTNSGYYTLTEHWNGTKWSVIPSPNSGSQFNDLTGVAAISANDIWAVGNSGVDSQTLIERWNGSSWSIVASPNPGMSGNSLIAVAAVSASDVWAVGYQYNGSSIQQTLIAQWNGTQWNVVSSPSPGPAQNELTGITVVSASDVWAVGYHDGNSTISTLIEQWNGSQWSVVSSPNAASGSFLNGVSAASASNIWAVGTYGTLFGLYQTLIEHWNGHTWSIVTSPNPGSVGNLLNAVAAISAGNAWTVGTYSNTQYSSQSLVEHWNGTAWSILKSPNVGTHPTSRN
jgi:hypothetical protein